MNDSKAFKNFYSLLSISIIYTIFAVIAYAPEKLTDGFFKAFFKDVSNYFFAEIPLIIALIIFVPSLISLFLWSDMSYNRLRVIIYKIIMCLVYTFTIGSTILWSTMFFGTDFFCSILAILFDIYVSAIAIVGLKNIFFNKKRSV